MWQPKHAKAVAIPQRLIQEASSNQNTANNTSGSESHHDSSLWNNQKNDQLASFMQKWGQTMHQSYEQYDGQNELKVSTGITYPRWFKQKN